MEKIDFRKRNIPFTQVANGVLYDKNLTLKAKGLYSYLYSKPDGWQFSSTRIAQETKDSRDAVRSAILELEQCGYLIRHKMSDGRMIYEVIFPPMTENPSQGQKPMTEKANDGKSHSGKIRPISNTDTYSNMDKTNNTIAGKPAEGNLLIPEIIKAFETVNPACKSMYGNKTQRKACEHLIDEYGLEEVLKFISWLPKTNKIPYVPQATTPVQLWEKWQAIRDAIDKKRSESVTTKKYEII